MECWEFDIASEICLARHLPQEQGAQGLQTALNNLLRGLFAQIPPTTADSSSTSPISEREDKRLPL